MNHMMALMKGEREKCMRKSEKVKLVGIGTIVLVPTVGRRPKGGLPPVFSSFPIRQSRRA